MTNRQVLDHGKCLGYVGHNERKEGALHFLLTCSTETYPAEGHLQQLGILCVDSDEELQCYLLTARGWHPVLTEGDL